MTFSTSELLPRSKSMTSLLLRADPPALTVIFRILTPFAPVKLKGSVSAAASELFLIRVASTPAPTNSMFVTFDNTKESDPRSKSPPVNLIVPPPAAFRSVTARCPTDFNVPL